MVVEAVQNYVNLVNGLTRMTRERALQVARLLLAQAGLEDVANDASERVTKLAEEIMMASRANRELVENLVAGEVDKAAARWGFVRSDDVAALREEIAELRLSLVKATVANASTSSAPPQPTEVPSAPAAGAGRTAAPAKKTAGRVKKSASQGPPLGGTIAQPGDEPNLPDPPLGEPLVTDPGGPGNGPLIPTPAELATEAPSPPESSTPVKSAAKKAAATKAAAKKASTAKASPAKATTAKVPAKKSAAKKSAVKKGALPAPAAPLTTPLPSTAESSSE